MSYYYRSNDLAVTDFDTFYVGTCQVQLDLYREGIKYFYTHELGIDKSEVSQTNNIISVPHVHLGDGQALAQRLISRRYPERLNVLNARVALSVSRLSRSIHDACDPHLYTTYRRARAALIELMASSNFAKTYIDTTGSQLLRLTAEATLAPQEREVVLGQPGVMPFLKWLEGGALKVRDGHWSTDHYMRFAYFLQYSDLSEYLLSLEKMDGFIQSICNNPALNKLPYRGYRHQEALRRAEVKRLRKRCLITSSEPPLLQLLLTAIDMEEVRHYWQARAIKEFGLLMIKYGLPIQHTSLHELDELLKGL